MYKGRGRPPPPLMKRCLPLGKPQDSSKNVCQCLFEVNLILLANTPTPGQYTNSWPFPVSLRVTISRPAAFAVD